MGQARIIVLLLISLLLFCLMTNILSISVRAFLIVTISRHSHSSSFSLHTSSSLHNSSSLQPISTPLSSPVMRFSTPPLCGSPRLSEMEGDARVRCFESIACCDPPDLDLSESRTHVEFLQKEETSQQEINETARMYSNRLLVGIGVYTKQLWSLHDQLVLTIRDKVGEICAKRSCDHERVLNEYLNRFVLLNRLNALDLSGEVRVGERRHEQTSDVIQEHRFIFQTVHESEYFK